MLNQEADEEETFSVFTIILQNGGTNQRLQNQQKQTMVSFKYKLELYTKRNMVMNNWKKV